MGCDQSKSKRDFEGLSSSTSGRYGNDKGGRAALLRSGVSVRFEQQLTEALAVSAAEQNGSAAYGGKGAVGGQLTKEREQLRQELVLLAPTIRLLFRDEMPDPRCSYAVPLDDDVDPAAARYLGDLINVLLEQQEVLVMPLVTTGDGSCMLHAASRGMWGVEIFSDLLRQRVLRELQAEKAWYCSRVSEKDWATACKEAATSGQYLGNLHLVALAHALRRPIFLYSSVQDVRGYGSGFYGVAFAAYPLRLPPTECVKRPVAIAWQSKRHDHFVPLVWSSCADPPRFPEPAAVVNADDLIAGHIQDNDKPPLPAGGSAFTLMDPFAVKLGPNGENPYLDYSKSRIQEPVFIQDLIERIRLLRTDVEARLRAGDASNIDSAMLHDLLPKSIYLCRRLSVCSSVSVPRDHGDTISESSGGDFPDLMRFSSNLITFSIDGTNDAEAADGGFTAAMAASGGGGDGVGWGGQQAAALPRPPAPTARAVSAPQGEGAVLWRRALSAYRSQQAVVNGRTYDYSVSAGGRVVGVNSTDNAFDLSRDMMENSSRTSRGGSIYDSNGGGGGGVSPAPDGQQQQAGVGEAPTLGSALDRSARAGDLADMVAAIAGRRRQEQVRRQTILFSSEKGGSGGGHSIAVGGSLGDGLPLLAGEQQEPGVMRSASAGGATLVPGPGDNKNDGIKDDGFASLAAALVRVMTELRCLQEVRPDGVDVAPGADLLTWKVALSAPAAATAAAAAGARRKFAALPPPPPPMLLWLHFPRNYPHSPPIISLRANRSGAADEVINGSGAAHVDENELNLLLARAWRPLEGLEGILVKLQSAIFPRAELAGRRALSFKRGTSSRSSGSYGGYMDGVDMA